MPNREQRRSLITLSDVEHVFDDQAAKRLARTAKLPSCADIVRFAASLRVAVRIYLEAQPQLSTPQMRAAIVRLYQLNTRSQFYTLTKPNTRTKAGNERAAHALARAVEIMPADVRNWLGHFCAPPTSHIPTAAEIISSETRKSAVRSFSAVLSRGGDWVIDRKRPSGKRSRSFKPLLNVPTVERKRPRGEAQREFVQWLALTYVEAMGKEPPYVAREASGPFCNFVSECFELAGALSGNVPRLINEYGKARRGNQPSGVPVTDICMTSARKK